MYASARIRLTAFFIVLAARTLAAQTPAPQSIRVDVELVMVGVSVVDSQNEPVTDLKRENFRIWEDKVEQNIQYFSTEDAAMSLGILFDVSHSMEPKIDTAREAAATFLELGSTEDEYFLIEFANRSRISQDFTTDIRRLRNAIAFKSPDGLTALYDAVYLGLRKVKEGRNPKKALLLITDGEDNHSRYSRSDVREFVRESDVQIFVVDLGRALVDDLAGMTGGRAYRASVSDLDDLCRKIAREIKSQYIMGYVSTNSARDGQWRRIQVRTVTPRGTPRLNIRAKSGYYASGN